MCCKSPYFIFILSLLARKGQTRNTPGRQKAYPQCETYKLQACRYMITKTEKSKAKGKIEHNMKQEREETNHRSNINNCVLWQYAPKIHRSQTGQKYAKKRERSQHALR